MGEKKGFLFVLFIISCFVVPAALDIWIANVRSDQFTKVATQVHQTVKHEGGVTDRIRSITDNLAEGGLIVTFTPNEAKPAVGTEIVIRYQYEYEGIIGSIKKPYDTTNKVIINRR